MSAGVIFNRSDDMRDSHDLRDAAVLAAMAMLLLGSRGARAQEHAHGATRADRASIAIPASIRAEHQEIHEELLAATKAPGAVGAAARELAAVLDPHFVREEQIALPPLGLLGPLSRGERTAEMRAVLPMSDSLRAELPRMLQEHVAIHAATVKLGEAARAAGNTAVAHLAEKLALHAKSEEEVFYPAAILVGDLVRHPMPHH
jgi:hypothetical protein